MFRSNERRMIDAAATSNTCADRVSNGAQAMLGLRGKKTLS